MLLHVHLVFNAWGEILGMHSVFAWWLARATPIAKPSAIKNYDTATQMASACSLASAKILKTVSILLTNSLKSNAWAPNTVTVDSATFAVEIPWNAQPSNHAHQNTNAVVTFALWKENAAHALIALKLSLLPAKMVTIVNLNAFSCRAKREALSVAGPPPLATPVRRHGLSATRAISKLIIMLPPFLVSSCAFDQLTS